MSIEQQAQLLSLTDLSGIGDKRALQLAKRAGGVQGVFQAEFEELAGLHYIDKTTYNKIQSLDTVIQEYKQRINDASSKGISLLTPLDDAYPDELRRYHSPLTLFVKGNHELLEKTCISFAGSRDANDTAVEWTKTTTMELVNNGYGIISGGAFGIDKAAHEAALNGGGDTVIVSPSGHGNPYPGAHSNLFETVEKKGLVVSHKFPDEGPSRGSFIFRNKTNSALGSCVVISAAGPDGGSMAQYDIATDQDRPVYVPTSGIGAEPYDGISQMTSTGDATSIESADEIISKLDSSTEQQQLSEW